jgi:beta-phosphoglucomutase-like phosphatase (HAD superfamily)
MAHLLCSTLLACDDIVVARAENVIGRPADRRCGKPAAGLRAGADGEGSVSDETQGEMHSSPYATPQTLDELSIHWRVALFAAQDALLAAGACGRSGLRDDELGAFGRSLAAERVETARLLEAVAQEERVPLHHTLAGPRATARSLGLPDGVRACVFDLDGVLTASAEIHAAAWRDSLNEFLSRRLERTGERFGPFRPFSTRRDYYRYLHGKPRVVGLHAFLASRGIKLPEGSPDDSSESETVLGLANRKAQAFQRRLEQAGTHAFEGTVQYLEDAREAGMRCAVISASANTELMLERAGLALLFDRIVDGDVMRKGGLESKPAPDTILTACRLLGVDSSEAATFETTVDGLEASRAAGVAFAVGVDRPGRNEPLSGHGAERVVSGLVELLDPRL